MLVRKLSWVYLHISAVIPMNALPKEDKGEEIAYIWATKVRRKLISSKATRTAFMCGAQASGHIYTAQQYCHI